MASPSTGTAAADLRRRLPELTIRDESRLRRRLDGARGIKDATKRGAVLAKIAGDVEAAEQRMARRRAAVPAITYPEALPVSQAREELLDVIRDHQVVVVAGETGSGKTTQLPKLCMELGRGVRGLIGHTQPRRIAARSVAARIAEELDVQLGQEVGSQVRFDDRTSDRTLVKVMTDGILLAEVQRDPALRAYDTIILDEAHERSLTIDFLLGYLRQLLPRRPDLKLIITSATIDPERFAEHFADAPVLTVSGRTYPVELRYRPMDEEAEDSDQITAIGAAVLELCDEGPGDILVFLSGEREIRDTADALRGLKLPATEVLPLYARLSAADQQRVFSPHDGRRIVLATNVAETSLTVPGIRSVVDPGFARISRYSNRTKVQRLPIEKISRASADQRKGRCGRVAEGICIRLYAEEDFAARPEFTDPEILRTNLASVILQMTALGLGDVEAFPFLDPPEGRSVRDAVQLLHELGAVTRIEAGPDQRLTEVGRQLSALPVDPRLGRMLIEAGRNACLTEVLVIVAALSIVDPRERPTEQRKAADEQHGRFADETSDFLSLLNLWRYLRAQQRELGSSAFRRRCKAEFLHFLRVREWQDVHSQLRAAVKDLGMPLNDSPAEPPMVHRSLLAGLLSHIGLKDGAKREYLGARGTRFLLWPGSALADEPPAAVMAAELVETSRLWARAAAAIDPRWCEEVGAHLVKRTYSEPRWSARKGSVIADEKVTLYGVPVAARRVAYGRIDREVSRDLFIRHALVQREWRTHHRFLAANDQLLAELADLEDRARRRDIVVDDEALYAFYDARLPAHITSARDFDRWWSDERGNQPELLTFTEDVLLEGDGPELGAGHPDVWHQGDLALALAYRFEPGAPDDGVTVRIPLSVLNRVRPIGFEWQVPAFREDLVIALLRGLPKDWRRQLVPVPDVARRVLPRLDPRRGALPVVLADAVRQATGVVVPADTLDLGAVPEHLRMSFAVVEGGREVGRSRDLATLQAELAGDVRGAVASAAKEVETSGHTTWGFASIPRTVTAVNHGAPVQGFPALIDEGTTVGIRVLLGEADQHRAMWQGARRLLLLAAPPPMKAVGGRLSNATKLALTRNPHGSVNALLEDCRDAAVVSLLVEHGGPAWDAEGWAALRASVLGDLRPTMLEILRHVEEILRAADDVERKLGGARAPALASAVTDATAHLRSLVRPGFVTATGRRRLPDVVRYVRGIERRMEKAMGNTRRDAELRDRITVVREEHLELLRSLGPAADAQAVRDLRWLIEELRVSLFAQELGTRGAVSEQRVLRAIGEAAVTARR